MFTSNGHFVTKYSFDSTYYDKHLKSHITPRGVCFTPNGDILVTDFENHRIMKLDGNLTMVCNILTAHIHKNILIFFKKKMLQIDSTLS